MLAADNPAVEVHTRKCGTGIPGVGSTSTDVLLCHGLSRRAELVCIETRPSMIVAAAKDHVGHLLCAVSDSLTRRNHHIDFLADGSTSQSVYLKALAVPTFKAIALQSVRWAL
jgi:hypothetical protein